MIRRLILCLAAVTIVIVAAADSYANDKLAAMRALVEKQKWSDIVSQFKAEDLAAWNDAPEITAEAASIRARAYSLLKEGASAEQDLKFAVRLMPKRGEYWVELGQLYMGLRKNEAQAVAAFDKAYEVNGKNYGWVSLSATINAATIVLEQGKVQDARKIMERYDNSDLVQIAAVWRDKMVAVNEKIADKLSASLLVIADKGVSDYQIVLPDSFPTPAIGADMQQVARLVQTAFKANGVELPIVVEAARDKTKPAIYLGGTEFARSHGVECKGWSYAHKVVGRDLIIAGRDEPGPNLGAKSAIGGGLARIGSAKGAVDFLQRFVGTRFLFPEQGGFQPLANVAKVDLLKTPTIEYLPTPRVAIAPDLDSKITPPLDYDICWPPITSFYHLAQNRFPAVDATFGGHTWHRAVPCEEADFKTHPERFALLGGRRQLSGSGPSVQFCLSNPDVQRLLYEDLEKHFKLGFQTVDLGQPDGFRGCECEACRKLFDTGSDWSEKVWIMHRKLAERMQEKFPDRTVSISVYAVTETLPKTFTTMPPNVQFLLAGTRDHELATWKNFGAPRGFSTYLYYWTPNQMPVYFPMRTPLYVERAAKRLLAANVKSIYRDGNGGVAFGLEGPTYYTMGRMFDGHGNPNAKDLVIEYVSAAFGKATPAMMRFYEELFHSLELYSHYMATREDGWSYSDMYGRKKKHLYSFEPLMAFLYPVELLQALDKQLAIAEKADASPKVQMRLALVRAEFNFLKDTVNAVHLYNASQVSPDAASLDRLLNAIDARRTAIDRMFVRGNEIKGWPFPLFPTPGHSAEAMKLRRDGYQEPYKNSFFNWDTAAKRRSPLPDAKRLIAGITKGAATMDSAGWSRLAPQTFAGTAVRVVADDMQLHLRFDLDLPANAGLDAVEKERVEAYLTPVPGSPVTFRFSAGLKPDSRTQAARGLIEDLLNLGYGKFDPLWKAEWTHTATHDAKANRLTVLMTIPLRSMPSAAVKPDQNWSVNFQRVSPAGTSAWSTLPGDTSIEDPRSYGELLFGSDGPASGSNPLKAAREKAWRDTFETPPQWKEAIDKGPTLALTNWRFRADRTEVGQKEQWFRPDRYTESDWLPIQVPTFWGEHEAVGNFQGEGWYRVSFTLPASAQGKSLRLMFAGADEQAWVYLNGKLIGEHSIASEKKAFTQLYDEPFIVEAPAVELKTDAPNVLCVRIHNQAGAGGLWRPVHVLVVSQPQ